jgi:hypothetical protein
MEIVFIIQFTEIYGRTFYRSSKIMLNLFCVMCVQHSEHHVLYTVAHTLVKTVRFTDN